MRAPALLLALAVPALAQTETVLVRASRIVVAADTVLENDALLLRGGTVAYVGKEIPEAAKTGATVLDYSGKTLVPGFVVAHTHLGQAQDLAERVTAATPELRASEGFDPFDPQLLRFARAGITTVGLAPTSGNVLAGLACAVRCGESGTLSAEATYLKVALTAESFDQGRHPTSLMGGAELLRARFQACRGAHNGHQPAKELQDVLSGARKFAVHARTHAEISSALELCEQFSVQPVLIDGTEAEKSLLRLEALKASLILAPLTLDSSPQLLRLPALLAARKIPFSFRADRPAELRLAVALALRHGLPRAAAWQALLRTPAEQCGLAEGAGALRAGMNADFAVYDGDPLDLSSRLVAVHVGGKKLESKP